jgi:RNA polymerase sigma factor (sigma-70 family)
MSVFSAGTSEGSELTSTSPTPARDADDTTDLDLVYRDARPRLIRLAVLLVDDLPTAEDVVQDVFVRLQRGTNAPVESIDRYLTTAVLNTARSVLRRRTVAARGLLRIGSRAATTHDDPGGDIAAMSTEQSRVWHAITQLPTRQRQVVVCRFYLDLSERDTARTLGVAAGTVKKSAARAMQALALTLGDHDG